MSVINLHYNCIFIHNPKTAGKSMRVREFVGGSGHKTAFMLRQLIDVEMRGAHWNTFFKFGFVRNPYDRYVSAVFRHHLDGKKYTRDRAGFEKFTLENEGEIRKLQWPGWQQLLPQHIFLCHEGKIAVDFVGKYETLLEDWKRVCDIIGVHDWLPWEDRGSHKHWEHYYQDERITRKVFDFYGKDFKIFYPEFIGGR